jgi:hypothetical protein
MKALLVSSFGHMKKRRSEQRRVTMQSRPDTKLPEMYRRKGTAKCWG